MQPFSPSHEAPAAAFVALWSTSHRFRPATVAAGPHVPTSNWACGRFPSGKVPFSSLDLALPCSACALLLRCCFSVSRPRKTRGHGPAPVTAQVVLVVPSPLPVSVPVPAPGPSTSRSHHLDFGPLAKAVNRLSYRGVACPVPASLKPGFCTPKIPPFSPPRPASDPLLSRALCCSYS